jgi:hypothetical protein
MEDLRTSKDWYANLCEFYSIKIMDYDGWNRDNFDYSFDEELITSEEFDRRLAISTIIVGDCPYGTKWSTFRQTHKSRDLTNYLYK